ncbi:MULTISPECIES: DUF4179 domain-containing protein [unclassified Paenibacillus]|uniref:DUF4179 domain-containing protein n=1 Tax=Paenibacillus TaxID=44249 RepID=UPI001575942F|nr:MULTISPECIES: DUF4179 domain-containing protein [unclassified Paenibacillus]NTZ16114.1 DUF4179 domain-containing protein [Paenibacillus sp. JMULE4]
MNEYNIDQALRHMRQKRKNSVPEFFSNGIEEVLTRLPEQMNEAKTETKKRLKWGWVQTTAAASIVFSCIIYSGFASPAMASILMKIPGLHFIYSATYEDVSKQPEDPHLLRGSQFHFGNHGPFDVIDKMGPNIKQFTAYSEMEQYIGMEIPRIPDQEGSIRVTDYNGIGYEIHAFNRSGMLLDVVPNAVNLPQFEGSSVNPVIKSTTDLNGLEADVLSYQFSTKNPDDRTSYITWQRNGFTLILAGTQPINQLIEVAQNIDKQAMRMKADKK